MWFQKGFHSSLHVTVPQSAHVQHEQVTHHSRRRLIKNTTPQKDKSLVMNCIQIHPLYSFHLIERNQVDYECLCSSVSLYAVDQRAGTVARWSGEGKWRMRAGGTEPTIKTFSCEEEPGIAALRIHESSLFLKALHWLGLTLHEMTPVQMLRVVRGAAGLSQTLSPFITKLLLVAR